MSAARAAVMGVIVVACRVASGQDADATTEINVRPQSIAAALRELGAQTGLQILFRSEDMAGAVRSAPGVSGRISARQALDQLLAGSGLHYEFVNAHTVRVSASVPSPRSSVTESPPDPGPGSRTEQTPTHAGGTEMPKSESYWSRVIHFLTRGGRRGAYPHRTMPGSAGWARLVAICGSVAAANGVCGVQQDSASQAAESGVLEEVVVTAARHEQNLQKVSSAVQVVSGELISNEGLTNIAQIVSDLPSVQATGQPGGFSINVRGQGGDLPAGSTQGSVALEFDGVYNINSQGTTVGFFDVDRIEVLPGPQSTRYGPDADGGVVNVITRNPQIGSWSGSGSLTLGDYGLVRTELAQDIALGSSAALRISGATLNRSSYFTDPAEGNVRAQSVRAKFLYQPSDALAIRLGAQVDHIGGTGNGSNVFPVFTNKVPVYPDDTINDQSNPWQGYPNIANTEADIRQNTFTGGFTWDLSRAAVMDLLSSYTTLSGDETACLYAPPWSVTGGGPFPICGARLHEFDPFHQFTSELRLHNGPESKIIWDLGLYHWDYLLANYAEDALFFSGPPVTTTTRTDAIYGEITYPVTDALRLIAGLRESRDHRTFNFNNGGTLTGFFDYNLNHFDYRAGAELDLSVESMAYLTVSTGYRPGGLSGYSNILGSALPPFAAEKNTAIELGIKNRFLENRVQLNADLFYYDQIGYQNLDRYTGFSVPDVSGVGTHVCGNPDLNTYPGCVTPTWNAKAHALGFETQAKASLSASDVLTFNATWLDAKFDSKQGTCATVGIDASIPGYAGPGLCYDAYNDQATDALKVFVLNGIVQPHLPKFSGNLDYKHSFHFVSGSELTLGGSVFYSTGYWLNPVHDDQHYGYQPGYTLENASLSFTPARGPWTVGAYVHNISDYAVKASVLPATSLGDPRTVGLVIGLKW